MLMTSSSLPRCSAPLLLLLLPLSLRPIMLESLVRALKAAHAHAVHEAARLANMQQQNDTSMQMQIDSSSSETDGNAAAAATAAAPNHAQS